MRATAAGAARTVVSFTFDDGDADQATGARILHRYHMAGTFYIITGAVGTPGYLTLAQLHWLAGQGDEIGAHTVSHLELTGITPAEARRQACMSRAILDRVGVPGHLVRLSRRRRRPPRRGDRGGLRLRQRPADHGPP